MTEPTTTPKKLGEQSPVNGAKDVPATLSVGSLFFLNGLDTSLAIFEQNANVLLAINAPEEMVLFWRRAQAHFAKMRDKMLGAPQPSIIIPERAPLVVP